MVSVVICSPFLFGLLWILYNVTQLPKMAGQTTLNESVSVLIPMRNETKNVGSLIKNLKETSYSNIEFILYDDDSTDDTAQKAEFLIAHDRRFKLLKGKNLPNDWKGKPHACFELAKVAKGEILLWIDADVVIKPKTISALVATMEKNDLDALSGFPKFKTASFLEALLTPLLHFFIHMHLPIQLANSQKLIAATAASGAFIAIRRNAYEAIGGHQAVKNEVVEDVALFRAIKKAGFRANLVQIADDVSCSMYGNAKETWQGFEKNCFKAFNESYRMASIVIAFYCLYFVATIPLTIYAIFAQSWLLLIPIISVTLQRLISDIKAKQVNIYTLFMPLSAFMYCLLLLTTMVKKMNHKKTLWKGREI